MAIVQCIENHFNWPELKVCREVQILLFPAVNFEEYDDELNNFCSVYREVNRFHLSVQLDFLKIRLMMSIP